MLGSPFGPRGRPLHALQPLRTLVHPLFIRFGGSAEQANTPNEECLFEHQNGASRPRERRDDFSRFQAWLKPCLGSLEQGTGLECLWTLWRARIQRPNRFEQIEHRTANRSRVGHEIQNARSSWPPASMGREGARTARCRRPPPGVHRPCPLLGLLGRRRVWGEKARVARRSCGYSPLLAGGQVSQEAAERGPSSTTACATRAYLLLTCPRASKPTSSSQGGPPSDKSVATCTYMPHRWMDAASHQKRQWSARADIRSYLRSACSREHARILGFDGLQHAGRE